MLTGGIGVMLTFFAADIRGDGIGFCDVSMTEFMESP